MGSDRRRVTPGFVIDERPLPPAAAVVPAGRAEVARPSRRRPIDVVGRVVPVIGEVPLPRRRRRRRADVDFASGFRNAWVAFWANLWTVGRWCAGASVALFFGIGAGLGQPWGWVAAGLPLAGLALWMLAVVRQGVRHARGQAGPPPGWIGRL